ncbi:MAG: aminotransferase class IV [Gammaproteobacteria bacterium]|nr:aminotransferase class IV [Gammaproteobacteria bacterium]
MSLTRGSASRGIDIPLEQKPNLFIYATHYSPPLAPKSAYITSIMRNEYSPSVNLKTLNYLDAILAKKQAAEQGYEDGLLLNTQGNAASFTTANLFVVLKGNIITPPLNEGVLNGIIRQHLITIAHSAGIPLMEKPLTVRECLQATEIFATNSLIEIQAIARLNEHLLATGEDAPMTQALKQTYFKERMRYS